MDKKKVIYIGILMIITVIVSITYFSYAFFTHKDEQHGKLNIVAGTLNYKIESDDLDNNNSIILAAGETREIRIKITSLNPIYSKYKLYYETNNNFVEVKYSSNGDYPSDNIANNGTKTLVLVITNLGEIQSVITFKIEGGFIGNELSLNQGKSIDDSISTVTVSFDANGGNLSSSSKQVLIGSTYGELPIPVRSGYNFKGWYLETNELSDTYQKVNFIEKKTKYSALGEYIDTGVNVNINNYNQLHFILDEKITDTNTNWNLSGSAIGGRNAIYVGMHKGYFYYGIGNDTTTSIAVPKQDNRYIYDLDIKNNNIIIKDYDNNVIVNQSLIKGTAFDQTGLPLYLMAYSGENRGHASKLYGAKIYINDVLERNFVPCYRKSDSIIGLYDTVYNKFYPNNGTGSFDIDYISNDTIVNQTSNHTLKAIWELK